MGKDLKYRKHLLPGINAVLYKFYNSSRIIWHHLQVTLIESPGLSSTSTDKESLVDLENYLEEIGYVTHVLLVWDAIERRYEVSLFPIQLSH